MNSDFDFESFDDDDESSEQEVNDNSFYEKIMEDASQAASILNIHIDVAFLCLQLVNFDFERLLSDYVLDSSIFLSKLNIKPENIHNSQQMIKGDSSKTITCNICYDDFNGDKMLSLPCSHFFCEDCWRDYIMSHSRIVGQNNNNVKENNSNSSTEISFNSDILKCMEHACNSVILPTDIKMICGQKVESAYIRKLNSKSIDMAILVKRCSNPKCNLLLNLDSVGPCGIVQCKCGKYTCWKCGEKAHAPLKCQNVLKWKSKVKGNADILWLTENTKQCPKCRLMIEKNGGCNHMTCQNCKYEFCWLCGHEWETHEGDPYSCMSTNYKSTDFNSAKNTMNDNNNNDKNDSQKDDKKIKIDTDSIINQRIKAELEESDEERETRLLKLFYLHKSEARKEKVLNTLAISKLMPLFDNDAKSVQKILEKRDFGRRILKWSYPYEYFLDQNSANMKIFKYLQKQLEIDMEKICFYVWSEYRTRKKIENSVKKVDLTVNSLLKHADEDRMYSEIV